jgi:hypothetical protein
MATDEEGNAMSSENSPWPILAIGIIGALIAGFGFASFDAVDLQNVTAAHVGEVFLTLVFVALLIERSTEVYVSTSLEPEKQDHLEPVRAQAARVRVARGALEAERKGAAPAAAVLSQQETALAGALQNLEAAKADATPGLVKIRNKISRRAGIVAATLGVLVALAGIRALHPFLPDAGVPGKDVQKGLFEAVDVLITAALLAGGADGLHQIVERFLKFAKKDDDPAA